MGEWMWGWRWMWRKLSIYTGLGWMYWRPGRMRLGEPSLDSSHPSQLQTPQRVNRLNGAEASVSLTQTFKIIEDVGAMCLGWPMAEELNDLIRDAQSACCGSCANAERMTGIVFWRYARNVEDLVKMLVKTESNGHSPCLCVPKSGSWGEVMCLVSESYGELRV